MHSGANHITNRAQSQSQTLTIVKLLQGAGESGQAEAYMCQKIMRSPFARGGIAKYLGTFVADATDRGFTRDTQWLIWKYESDTTLAEACQVPAASLILTFPEYLSLSLPPSLPTSLVCACMRACVRACACHVHWVSGFWAASPHRSG